MSQKRKAFLALFIGVLLLTVTGLIFYYRNSRNSSSTANSAPTHSPAEGKSVKELNEEFEKANAKLKRSPEWLFAEQGQTDKIIEAYKTLKVTATLLHQERIRLIGILNRTAKPRKEWPRDFNTVKANQLMKFLSDLVTLNNGSGPEPVAAMNAITHFASLNPEYQSQAEKILVDFYVHDTRPAPRGGCLMDLGTLQSKKGFKLALEAAKGGKGGPNLQQIAVYTLSTYAQTPLYKKEALEGLRYTAKNTPKLRALSVKLLAHHQDAQAEKWVTVLLGPGATPADIEAGIYTINQFKLKQYRELLTHLDVQGNSYLNGLVHQALDGLDK